MKLPTDGELSLISYIRERFKARPGNPAGKEKLLVGIGDDCAVFDAGGRQVAVTTDAMAEGVHFDHSYCTPYQIGFKLVTVNVSDVFAMNASPSYMLLSLTLPAGLDKPYFTAFMDGVMAAIEIYGINLIGGDITSSLAGVTVSATLIGFTDAPIKRTGAKAGDFIYVSGYLGDSACGLKLLKKLMRPVFLEKGEKIDSPLGWATMQPLLGSHLMPQPVKPVVASGRANSMIDVSDGLSIDLRRLCAESRVGAVIYEERLPMSKEMIAASDYLKHDPLEFCLCGGEDYKYLFTSPVEADGAFCIGEIVVEAPHKEVDSGQAGMTNSGVVLVKASGEKREMVECGYEHFKN